MGGIGMRGPSPADRSHSRGSKKSITLKPADKAMRESTISFFKEVFGENVSTKHTKRDQQSNFADDLNEMFDNHIEPVAGNSMSLLKSRRMSAKKALKPPRSPFIDKNNKVPSNGAFRPGNRSSVKMSNDIQSLINDFHSDSNGFK